MPLEYFSIGFTRETVKALDKEAARRGVERAALIRELVVASLTVGPSTPTAQAPPMSTSSPVPVAAYFVKGEFLCKRFATFDYEIGKVAEVEQLFRDKASVDPDKIAQAERGMLGFYGLTVAEKKIVSEDLDLAKKRGELEIVFAKAKAARLPPRGIAPRGPYPDAERFRRCGGCSKLFGNMSSDERRAHGGQDCTRPQSSTVLVEGVPMEKSKLPSYMLDSRGELKPEIKALEAPPSSLPHPAVGGEGA